MIDACWEEAADFLALLLVKASALLSPVKLFARDEVCAKLFKLRTRDEIRQAFVTPFSCAHSAAETRLHLMASELLSIWRR